MTCTLLSCTIFSHLFIFYFIYLGNDIVLACYISNTILGTLQILSHLSTMLGGRYHYYPITELKRKLRILSKTWSFKWQRRFKLGFLTIRLCCLILDNTQVKLKNNLCKTDQLEKLFSRPHYSLNAASLHPLFPLTLHFQRL